ncbi:hypothetical protein GCM10009038_03280 [Salinicola rhizosphaerae]|uniref:Uncharacterized protein n=2 Tax=Salinicola rhizosphaerae TaxID=1443141 RepID=A0ABQ3DQY3_9GAMM|nr:hypothetical protein GCM10009038_03280 [Salinicola rhizosphaerae]
MLALSVICSLFHWPIWPAAVLAWLATLRLFRQLPRTSRRQAGVLFGCGVALWLAALVRGTPYSLLHALTINQSLVMMFAGVSFLTMATPQAKGDTHQIGSRLGTMLGAHLFGAAINLSVVFLFGERMQHEGRLTRSQALLVGRGFTAAAAWSPFFVAMGVALTYAPGLNYVGLVPWGILAAILLLSLNYLDIARLKQPFVGYPIEKSALLMPCLLAIVVIGLHLTWPDLSIPLIIAMVSPLFSFLLMPKDNRRQRMHHQFTQGLQRLAPQFALFLGAGVISSGLAALLASFPDGLDLPLDHFGHWQAWFSLGLIVVVSFTGIHPLIGIATLAPLVAPLNPDPTLLGLLFLMSWALGTGSSPLSGSNLAICVRYQIAVRDMLHWNLPYAIVGWLCCGLVFGLHAALS